MIRSDRDRTAKERTFLPRMISAAPRSRTCFFERDPGVAVSRRAAAEGVGTFLLVLTATGAGSAVARLAADRPALILIASATATTGGRRPNSDTGGEFNVHLSFMDRQLGRLAFLDVFGERALRRA